MDIEKNTKNLPIKPYRSLGLFIGKLTPKLYTCGKTRYMLCLLNRGFKIYEVPKMKIKLISGDLPG